MWLLNYLANPLGLCMSCWGSSPWDLWLAVFHYHPRSREKKSVKVSVRWESVLTLSLPVRKPRQGFRDLCLISFWYCSFGGWLALYGTLRGRVICSVDSVSSRLLLLLAKGSFCLYCRSVWGLFFMSQHFQAPWHYRQANPGAYRFCQ